MPLGRCADSLPPRSTPDTDLAGRSAASAGATNVATNDTSIASLVFTEILARTLFRFKPNRLLDVNGCACNVDTIARHRHTVDVDCVTDVRTRDQCNLTRRFPAANPYGDKDVQHSTTPAATATCNVIAAISQRTTRSASTRPY
jgi:hypothetical protein